MKMTKMSKMRIEEDDKDEEVLMVRVFFAPS